MPDGSVERLLGLSLDSFREEYSELSETWRQLDGKAQATASMAGIFVGGLFAVLKLNPPALSGAERVLLTLAVAALAGAVVLSLLALFIRQVPAAPRGDTLHALVRDLLGLDDQDERHARVTKLLQDMIRMWSEANEQIHETNLWKARRLQWAQGVLLCGILLTAALVLVLTYR